jgi:hypothetical protein
LASIPGLHKGLKIPAQSRKEGMRKEGEMLTEIEGQGQGVTKRCRLSIYLSYISPNAGGGVGSCGVSISTAVHMEPK